MAKPKQEVMVVEHPTSGLLVAYVDNAPKWVSDVMSIEGIRKVFVDGKTRLDIFIDPRYDLSELAEEVKSLLMAEVPVEFREA